MDKETFQKARALIGEKNALEYLRCKAKNGNIPSELLNRDNVSVIGSPRNTINEIKKQVMKYALRLISDKIEEVNNEIKKL